MESTSRRILYAENADIRMPMASTTKVLTAITALEFCENLYEKITIPREAVGIEGSSIYAKEGEIYTVEDLLYGMMLRSGNDAATALALHFGGSISNFCAKMNETAQKSGALHSRFENPHGLPCENHYTTATDLSLITCYALKNPIFYQIAGTRFYEPRGWYNKNKLLQTYEGAIGVKTGYTKEAGRCLVAAAERENMQLVCTLLNCYDHYQTAEKLLNDCFLAYQMTEILSTEESFDVLMKENKVSAHVQSNVEYPLSEGEKEHLERQIVAYESEKMDGSVGEIEIWLANRLIFSEKLYKL
ncbi:MAG: D-alanyl-D-alanine carboxypeptidase [Clostridia bacterium]|nr:D-alanyl-D-alanine carboxypeptidase [Clostridia bacterium]